MKKLCILSLFLVVFSAACLKTRAQLKDDPQPTGASRGTAKNNDKDEPQQNQYAVDELKSEITRLTGRIEDLERDKKDDSSEKKLNETVQTLENRITQLEQSQMAMLEEMKKKPGHSSSNQKPDSLFEKGKEQFNAGKLEDAVETFSAYIESSDKKHIEDALFMRGEAHYGLGDFKKAIVDFSKFPEKYRKSKKIPAALYKIGLSFDAMSMREDAKAFYQEIVDKYEDSPEAKKAAKKLASKAAPAPKTGKKKPAKP